MITTYLRNILTCLFWGTCLIQTLAQTCKEITNITSITCRPPFVAYSNFSVPLDTGECSQATLAINTLSQQYHVINAANPWVAGTTINWSNDWIRYISFWWWGTSPNGTVLTPNNTFVPIANITPTTTTSTREPLILGIKNNMPCLGPTRCFHTGTEVSETNPHHFMLVWFTNTATSATNFRVFKDGFAVYTSDATVIALSPLIGRDQYITRAIPTEQYAYTQVFDLRIYTAPQNQATLTTAIQGDTDPPRLFGCGPSRGYGQGCILPSPVITASAYPLIDYEFIGKLDFTAQNAHRYDIQINKQIRTGNGYNLPGFSIFQSITTYPTRFILSLAVRRIMNRGAVGSVNPVVMWYRATRVPGMISFAEYKLNATDSIFIAAPTPTTSATSNTVAWRLTGSATVKDTTKWEMIHVLVNLTSSTATSLYVSRPSGDFQPGGNFDATTFPTSLGSTTTASSSVSNIDANGIWVSSAVGFFAIHPIPTGSNFIPNPNTFLQHIYSAASGGVSSSASWYPPIGPVISTALTTAGYFRPPFACNGRCSIYVSVYNSTQTRALPMPNSNAPDGLSKVCYGSFYNSSNACQTICPLGGFEARYGLCTTGQPCLCGAPRVLANDSISCICPNETTQFGQQCQNCTCVAPAVCNSGVLGNGTCTCPANRPLSTDPKRCKCLDELTQFGDNCTQCSCESPAICNSGVLGNGTCRCPSPFVLRADGKGCQCANENTQYGPLCNDCNCISPAICNAGFANNGMCSCPFPLSLQNSNNSCDCIDNRSQYGPTCVSCNCQSPAWCNGGINGTDTCFCASNQYLVPPANKSCECINPSRKYGPSCLPCNCTGTAECDSGISGTGTCICPGNQVYDPVVGCSCANSNTYGIMCRNCTCNNHPAQTCDGITGECICKNGLYLVDNTCVCPDNSIYNSSNGLCVSLCI